MTQDRAKTQDPPARKVMPGGSTPQHAGSPNTERAPAAGTLSLGRYRVVEEIGVGGMASVHLARMDGPGGFQKWVAIKRIHPHLIADESFIQMFLDEARIAARISHPNVATVFELGRHGNTYWIAMEYLHGEPLREVMRRTEEVGGPMPPEIASRIIADAAEGLHSAHELLGKNGEKLNLIHRDVTPHNLFVTYEGATKVVDFGIAKCNSRMSSTRAGTLKGKLAYMSPEQVQGESIDRRTDIFALGVVLWELTTGQRLFRVDGDLATLAKVRECDIPRPSRIIQAYPVDLENIVMKALSKNRKERFTTAREFSRALQSLLMRRGLFTASEEVAGYIQFIFRERIRRREAHLRWAGNLTRTPPREKLYATQASLASPATPSFRTYISDTQAAIVGVQGISRPAAGIPASQPGPAGARRADATRPTASAHGTSVGFAAVPADEADTIVIRQTAKEHLPFQLRAASLARHAGPGSDLRRSKRPGAPPSALPVWAAAAISGTLALLPASGIFLAVSRAMRPSAKVAANPSSSDAPSSASRTPDASRQASTGGEGGINGPGPPAPANRSEDSSGGTVFSSAP